MSYLIILLVIAMAVAPVLALKPTKKQRLLVRLRDRARLHALQVQLGELPQTHRQKVRLEDPEPGAAYRILWRHEEAKTRQFQYVLHRDEVERISAPETIVMALREALDNLPENIVAVEFSNLGVAVYWRETGDEAEVDLIANQLSLLKDHLATWSL